MIATIRREHPEAIFLAEAFTRPRVMERLAKIGFNQSYTYFTWRQSAWELRDYFEELATRTVDYLRPNAWPNTPDILTEQLQTRRPGDVRHPGRPRRHAVADLGHLRPGVRAAASTRPCAPGRRSTSTPRSTSCASGTSHRADSLAPLLGRLNRIRREQPALHHLRTLRFHQHRQRRTCSCYSKTDPAETGPPVLVVVNLDSRQPPGGLRRRRPGRPRAAVRERLRGRRPARRTAAIGWHGAWNYVDLDPSAPAHIFRVEPA